MLTIMPNGNLFFHLPGDDIQNKLFHHFTRDRGEADRPVVFQVFIVALYKDCDDTGFPSVLKHFPSSPQTFKNVRE